MILSPTTESSPTTVSRALERSTLFARELAALLQQHEAAENERMKIQVVLARFERENDTQKMMEVAKALDAWTQRVAVSASLVCERASRSVIADARDLLEEISVRIENARSLQNNTVRENSKRELLIATGALNTEERAEAEAAISKLRSDLMVAVDQADQLVPRKPVLLSVSGGLSL